MILCLAILIQYQCVADKQRDRRTDRWTHYYSIYSANMVKTGKCTMHERIPHCLPDAAGECVCLAHTAN